MEEELTYEQLVNKVKGAAESLFVLSRRLDRFHKRNANPEENPMLALGLAAESIRNFSDTLDTFVEVMSIEAPEE